MSYSARCARFNHRYRHLHVHKIAKQKNSVFVFLFLFCFFLFFIRSFHVNSTLLNHICFFFFLFWSFSCFSLVFRTNKNFNSENLCLFVWLYVCVCIRYESYANIHEIALKNSKQNNALMRIRFCFAMKRIFRCPPKMKRWNVCWNEEREREAEK